MKFLKTDTSACSGARACEKACAMTFFKKEDSAYSCILHQKASGKSDLNVCNQCGACIEVCPVKALSRNKLGVVMVDKKTCIGCFMCVGFCPTVSMRRAPGSREPFKCVSCGACVKACPSKALSLSEKDHAGLPC
ncbi:MAG: 4Fe-4S dicluster domain-containing protein [Candidatus Riflebacteria bacterium]|nr:4Fe-4S dicluster domain-containing protein [Candidatus Riflebacteria bacterium]